MVNEYEINTLNSVLAVLLELYNMIKTLIPAGQNRHRSPNTEICSFAQTCVKRKLCNVQDLVLHLYITIKE